MTLRVQRLRGDARSGHVPAEQTGGDVTPRITAHPNLHMGFDITINVMFLTRVGAGVSEREHQNRGVTCTQCSRPDVMATAAMLHLKPETWPWREPRVSRRIPSPEHDDNGALIHADAL